ncbi:hypothetical protein [Zooshikella ganghwensis]|uniref:hypothetical protein n=1 Tax=Zooshikella ganghwensis TaxID=202772 RepID=UPI0013FE1152|nr:hypothetical protein [Zooshikella ganghwensis]
MAKKFSQLKAKMSAAARLRAAAKTNQLLQEINQPAPANNTAKDRQNPSRH